MAKYAWQRYSGKVLLRWPAPLGSLPAAGVGLNIVNKKVFVSGTGFLHALRGCVRETEKRKREGDEREREIWGEEMNYIMEREEERECKQKR